MRCCGGDCGGLTAVVVSKASEPLGEGELVIVVVEYMLLTSTTAELIDGGGMIS